MVPGWSTCAPGLTELAPTDRRSVSYRGSDLSIPPIGAPEPGQGEADAAAVVAGQMLDQAAGMESCRIEERILKVRCAVVEAGNGRAAKELAERVGDITGVPMRPRG